MAKAKSRRQLQVEADEKRRLQRANRNRKQGGRDPFLSTDQKRRKEHGVQLSDEELYGDEESTLEKNRRMHKERREKSQAARDKAKNKNKPPSGGVATNGTTNTVLGVNQNPNQGRVKPTKPKSRPMGPDGNPLPEGWRLDQKTGRYISPDGRQHLWREGGGNEESSWITVDNIGDSDSADEVTSDGKEIKLEEEGNSKVPSGMNAAAYNAQVTAQQQENARLQREREEARKREEEFRQAELKRQQINAGGSMAEQQGTGPKDNGDGSVSISKDEYYKLTGSPPSTDQGPSMQDAQGTGAPQVQQNMPGTVQGEQQVQQNIEGSVQTLKDQPTMEEAQRQQIDPNSERAQREIAQMYNDTGLPVDEPSMQEAQAPQPEPEFTGYTEDTAAAAFVNPETGVDQTGVDTGADQTPEQKRDGFLAEIQDNLLDVVNKAGFDPDEYRASQQGALEQRYVRAQEALARRFYLQPGGAMSGDAQLAFENLAAEHNQDLAALDKDIADREKEAINTQLDAYNNIFQTAATDDRERLKITQNSEQFAESMRLELKKFGLTEKQTMAAIDKIFNDIKNNDERTALEVGTTWADVLGFTGTESGQLGAEDLGLELTDEDMMSAFLPTGNEETKQKIRDLVKARTGQEPSDAEVQIIMSGQKANFNNIPTLESRRLSQENSQQNMERAAKYGSIAQSLGLDRAKFNQSVKEYDNKWALSIGDTASLNGLDENAFTAARYEYDNFANEIFFNESLSPAEKSAALAEKTNEIAAKFGDQAQAFIRANTQFEQTIGAQQQATARQLGISSEQYRQAQGQIDRTERKMEAMWASLIAGQDAYEIEIGGEGMTPVRVSAFRDMGKLVNDMIQAGTIDARDGQGASIAQQFIQNADDETLAKLNNAFMVTTGGNAIFTDVQMEQNLGNIIDNFFPSGPVNNGLFNLADVQQGMDAKYTLQASPADWWQNLDPEQMNAWMSLLGSGSFQASPERQGVNWMGMLGRAAGAGLGFALTGGTAAGAAAGFNYGGQFADAGGR
jgi:hypothetical protein